MSVSRRIELAASFIHLRPAGRGAGGAQRPLTALEGWCDAAERTFFGTEPAGDEASGALGRGAHSSTAARLLAPTTDPQSEASSANLELINQGFHRQV